MSRRRRQLVLASLVVLGLLVGAAFAAYATTRSSSSVTSARTQLARQLLKSGATPGHMDKLLNGGEADRSGGRDPFTEEYDNRAFPNSAINFAQTETSIKDAKKILKHTGTKFPKPWDAIGPETLNVATLGTQTFGPPTQWSGRVTALAIDPKCGPGGCKLYVAAAGGGVWRTNDALAGTPNWKQISEGSIPSTAIGSLLIDPTDPTGRTLYAGTGEGNGSSDSEAGIGLYRSTDGGNSWALVPGSYDIAKDRAIAAIAVDPANRNHILIGTAVARHGLSSKSGGRFTPPDAPTIGLYSSSNGGSSFSLILNRPQDPVDPTSPNGGDFFRGGITKIEYDPNSPSTYYASMFGYGLFRTLNNGASFDTIYADTLSPADLLSVRYEFATAKLAAGTRATLPATRRRSAPSCTASTMRGHLG
jgi:hypothetical protein